MKAALLGGARAVLVWVAVAAGVPRAAAAQLPPWFWWWPMGSTLVINGADPTLPAPVTLFDGYLSSSCRNDLRFQTNPVHAGMVYITSGCRSELVIFSRERGTYGLGSPRWELRGATISLGFFGWLMRVPVPSSVSLPVAMYVVSAADVTTKTTALGVAAAQAEDAKIALETLGSGFTLSATTQWIDAAGTTAGTIGDRCSQAPTIAASAPSLGIYDPDRLNVYLVKLYESSEFSAVGYDCANFGHPEIIFIAWAFPGLGPDQLAHELGHALGLRWPNNGHSDTYGAPFNNANMMWPPGGYALNLSLGQIYRMNFDSQSWVNRPAVSASRPLLRTCQDVVGGSLPCPALNLFPPAGWVP